MTQETTPAPSLGERLAKAFLTFIKVLLRLLVIVILIGLIVAVVYYAAPRLYNQYIFPMQEDIRQLEDSQAAQEQVNQQLIQRIDGLQNRIEVLEIQNDTSKQMLSELDNRINNIESTLDANAQAVQDVQATAIVQIDELNKVNQDMNNELAALERQIQQLEADLADTSEQVASVEELLSAEDTPIAALRRELQLVKAMELLTRASFSLAENNLGLAQEDLQDARDLLSSLLIYVPEYQVEALSAIVDRLDEALGNLPDTPVLAADDLDIAWQLLQRGLPGEPPLGPASEEIVTPTPEGSTPTSQPTETPTS